MSCHRIFLTGARSFLRLSDASSSGSSRDSSDIQACVRTATNSTPSAVTDQRFRDRADLGADERGPLGNDRRLLDTVSQTRLFEKLRESRPRSAEAVYCARRSSASSPIWPSTIRNRGSDVISLGMSIDRGTARIV